MITVARLDALRDRYPTPAERDHLAAYAESVGGRLFALQEMNQIAAECVEGCMAQMRRMYPNIPRFHASGFEKGSRDNLLLLEYMTKCMLLDDIKLLDEQVLTWVRTLFKSFNFTPKFMRDNFTLLREAVRARAKPRTFALMEPYLTHTIDYLSDIPEPVRPEV
jgi:Phycobilisome protein